MAKGRPGQRARLWAALGGSARLLTGRRPFDTPGEVEASDLRLSQRRPSVPGDMDALPRLVQAELKVAHEGWLTKHSKSGLPNWNRRWFTLIGGTLYYSKSDRSYVNFAELLHGKRVEAVSSDGGGVKFRLVLADQTLEFQAASVAARLEWMSQLEAHLGMQPVPVDVLLNGLRKESAHPNPSPSPNP